MASSGSFKTTAYYGRHLVFSWSETSQSIANNTTTISWTLKGAGGDDTWYLAQNITVIIDGETVYNRPLSAGQIELGNGTTVTSGTYTFAHNADGTRSFKAEAKAGIYVHAVNCTGSADFDLDTIARASKPSCITYPNNTQNVGEFGDVISIHMNRQSSSFTHTVRYQFGSQSGTCVDADTGKPATSVGTGFRWQIPVSLMNLIPNDPKGSGTIYVDTYNGSTKVGTESCGFTATVPADVKPSCDLTLEDITGVDRLYGTPVAGLSKIKITVTATQAYSSPIDTYKITANGVTYSASEVTTGVLKKAYPTITATVTDKRGRSGSDKYTMRVQDYSPPAITALTAKRCNQDGTLNKRGAYVKVTFSAAVSSMGSKNTAIYKLHYKKTSASAYGTPHTFTDLTNVYSVSNQTYIFAASAGSSYDVMVEVTDRHNTSNPATRNVKVSTAASIFSWRGFKTSSGVEDGAGIGKVPEKPNCLQVGWDAEFDNIVVRKGNRYAFSSPGVASTAGYVRIAQLTHVAENADSPITFVISQRLQPTPMTVHVQFRTDSTTVDPQLKGITYEGTNYGAFLVKSATSVWDLYVQKVSAYDTITINEWYSSSTVKGRLNVTFPGDLVAELPEPYYRATPAKLDNLLDYIYPVGSIYLSYNHNDPAALFGGTWVRITNRFLWAVDASGAIGATGGEKTHTLTVNEMPSHHHGSVYSGTSGVVGETYKYGWYLDSGDKMAYGTISTGGGAAHNNMPPYIQISVWRRTA